MTAPRRIVPGQYYMIGRRCTQRQFLLRPDEKTNGIFLYCLAEAARRTGIQLLAWMPMANHYHAVVFDPLGSLPAFLEQFHKMLAKVMNARLGRWENFWSSEETCVTHLATEQDVLDKIVYTLVNPVAADLVERAEEWPGASSLDYLDGVSRNHPRPEWFFSPAGVMPATVELEVSQPPFSVERGESMAVWAAKVRNAVRERERELADARLQVGKRVLGAKQVTAESVLDAPSSLAPRRNLRPAVACSDRERRKTLLRALREFRAQYRHARERFRAGEFEVEFPAGTYRLCLLGAKRASLAQAA